MAKRKDFDDFYERLVAVGILMLNPTFVDDANQGLDATASIESYSISNKILMGDQPRLGFTKEEWNAIKVVRKIVMKKFFSNGSGDYEPSHCPFGIEGKALANSAKALDLSFLMGMKPTNFVERISKNKKEPAGKGNK